MPLICPKCKNKKSFSTIGSKHNQIKCFECGYMLDIDKDWSDID